MNILRHPEEANPDAVVTGPEFQELAIEAGWMEDLMDRTDLKPGQFLDMAVARANAARTSQNLHLWVANVDRGRVYLVRSPLVAGIQRSVDLARALQEQADILHQTAQDLLEAKV
jgi:hypothetical protein